MCNTCGGTGRKVEVAAGFSHSIWEASKCGCKPGVPLEIQLKLLDERITAFVEGNPEYNLSV